MAQKRAFAGCQQGGNEVRVAHESHMPHSEDTSVKGKQVASLNPSSNLGLGEPGPPELRA